MPDATMLFIIARESLTIALAVLAMYGAAKALDWWLWLLSGADDAQ